MELISQIFKSPSIFDALVKKKRIKKAKYLKELYLEKELDIETRADLIVCTEKFLVSVYLTLLWSIL